MIFFNTNTGLKRVVPALLIGALVSCSKETADGTTDPLEIRFAVENTKSTDTYFENGDELSLFAGSPVNATNVKLIYRNGALQPESPVKWAEGQTEATTFDAVFPYSAGYGSATISSFTVKSDQSSKSAFNASDLMTATTSAAPDGGTVKFTFSHKLAKFEISVTSNVSGATVTGVSVSGIKLGYDLTGAAASGSAGTIKAYPLSAGSRYCIILAPQSASPVINVSLSNGKTYSFNCGSASTFAAGSRNRTAITVTPGEGDTPPSSTATTKPWFEMPAIADKDNNRIDDNNKDYYYAYHSFTLNGRTVRNYTVCFSADHHCAMWVAAPMHSSYTTGSGRSGYSKDPDIPSSIQYSGTDTGGGCNKGHLLSSADRSCCTEANKQVFYYSNIAPQESTQYNTGGGGWNILEEHVKTLVCSDTLYAVIGCYYDTFKDGYNYSASPKTISFGGRNDVDVPTMFYYALLRTKSGKTGKKVSACSASELKCVAFVRSHNKNLKGVKPSSKEMMSISDLEKITGFSYFVNVPNAPKDTYNPSEWL